MTMKRQLRLWTEEQTGPPEWANVFRLWFDDGSELDITAESAAALGQELSRFGIREKAEAAARSAERLRIVNSDGTVGDDPWGHT